MQMANTHPKETEEVLIQWARQQPLVRAMLLTSTRAVPNAPLDIFSDYDVILVVRDVQPFASERAWLEDFGPVLALYRDPLETSPEGQHSGNVTQFENGLKIDFTFYAVPYFQHLTAQQLPDEFDAGYRVLLDKDHLTDELPRPSYAAYIPRPPSEEEYQDAIEVSFLEAIYAAKLLWRDDLMAAKFVLDTFMKHEHLRPMLEWHVETENDWAVKTGPYGRGLKKWLRSDLWAELEQTYSGPGRAENWETIYRMVALMGRVAREVGQRMGYPYPEELERRTMRYLEKVKNTPPKAQSNRSMT